LGNLKCRLRSDSRRKIEEKWKKEFAIEDT